MINVDRQPDYYVCTHVSGRVGDVRTSCCRCERAIWHGPGLREGIPTVCLYCGAATRASLLEAVAPICTNIDPYTAARQGLEIVEREGKQFVLCEGNLLMPVVPIEQMRNTLVVCTLEPVFPDDVEIHCPGCDRLAYHRPNAKENPRKLCVDCVETPRH